MGNVIVGRGSLTWIQRKGQIGKRTSWSELAEIMQG